MKMAKDPVCDMEVDASSSPSATHNNTTYYFCCNGCKAIFEKKPEAYLPSG